MKHAAFAASKELTALAVRIAVALDKPLSDAAPHLARRLKAGDVVLLIDRADIPTRKEASYLVSAFTHAICELWKWDTHKIPRHAEYFQEYLGSPIYSAPVKEADRALEFIGEAEEWAFDSERTKDARKKTRCAAARDRWLLDAARKFDLAAHMLVDWIGE